MEIFSFSLLHNERNSKNEEKTERNVSRCFPLLYHAPPFIHYNEGSFGSPQSYSFLAIFSNHFEWLAVFLVFFF